ncbi:50S ribosome-binding GTPase [Vibrio metschnikovii]|nr:50S ribosome-binding GTPase [Vibrio metschnikovii]
MNQLMQRLAQAIEQRQLLLPLDVLLVGATGCGKSSTINALAGKNLAKIGRGVDPETQHLSDYSLSQYLRLHDSAGLGDGRAADLNHAKVISEQLQKTCTAAGEPNRNYALIDMVMVILEGGLRDLGTSFQLLESVILPQIQPERVVVVINQADMVMKGRHWHRSLAKPEPTLAAQLAEKSLSVQRRIQQSTGLKITEPVCYSAEYGYNLERVMSHIIAHLPTERRSELK